MKNVVHHRYQIGDLANSLKTSGGSKGSLPLWF
jgi:hypothetical protein